MADFGLSGPLSEADRGFLDRAMELGRKGWGRVHPNPMVGCVLVKDGKTIGEGWHEQVGGPHAEVNALAAATDDPEGATAYVSLEPCNHFGRTPPCSKALQEAGIKKLVFAAADPGPLSSGGGRMLQAAGVEVVGPTLSREEARRENPAFFHAQEAESPYVAVKLAQSLDGRVAEAAGKRTPITGAEAKLETHRLRAGFDAVMVGSGTALIDDPMLTVREPVPMRTQPTRVVLDTKGALPPDAALFQAVEEAPLVIFTGPDTPEATLRRWEAGGASATRVAQSSDGLDLPEILRHCWTLDIKAIFCEGGPRLATRLLVQDLAQRLYLFLAPFVLGEEGVPAFSKAASRDHWMGWDHAEEPRRFGRDALLVLDRKV